MEKKALNLPCNGVEFKANIFYWLLLSNMHNPRLPGDNYAGHSGKLTQTHMFVDLVRTLKGHLEAPESVYSKNDPNNGISGSLKNAASKFKSGQFNSQRSSIYLLKDQEVVGEFNALVTTKEKYLEALERMVEFSQRYFNCYDVKTNTPLIQKILYLIFSDNGISESQEFYICSNGSTKTKADLRSIEEIEFEAFLLGIWHFLIVSHRDQVVLENVNKIIVDIAYQNIKFNLTNSKIQNAPTAPFESSEAMPKIDSNNDSKGNTEGEGELASESSEAMPQTDSSNDSKASDESEGELAKETKGRKATIIVDKEKARKIKEVAKSHHIPSELDEPKDPHDFNIISALANNDIRLSRGVFFYMLTQSIQADHPKRKKVIEKLFVDLLQLIPNAQYSIDLSQSEVRGEYDKFGYLKTISAADCLDDAKTVTAFSVKLRSSYDEVLPGMVSIREKYFNSEKKNEALTYALVEFIRHDDSIEDNQEFLVCSDGTALTKTQLCEDEEIQLVFEPLLLGIWHYVVMQLQAKDFADKITYDKVLMFNYTCNREKVTEYRSMSLFEEQSELFIELCYLDDEE